MASVAQPRFCDYEKCMTMKCLLLDIETEPFSLQFCDAISDRARMKHAPKMRVAWVFDELEDGYRYYTPDNADCLIAELQSADEAINFNGTRFDLLVLRTAQRCRQRAWRN